MSNQKRRYHRFMSMSLDDKDKYHVGSEFEYIYSEYLAGFRLAGIGEIISCESKRQKCFSYEGSRCRESILHCHYFVLEGMSRTRRRGEW